jgi:hypothetical protein
MRVNVGTYSPFNHETLTVNAVTSLTLSLYNVYALEHRAILTLETDQIRYWIDGTVPTSLVGHLLNPGDVLVLENMDQLKGFRGIKVTNNASLNVSYLKR